MEHARHISSEWGMPAADVDSPQGFARQRQEIIERNRARMRELDLPALAAQVLPVGRGQGLVSP